MTAMPTTTSERTGVSALPAETTGLVVGGGPIGLITSILLDLYGIDPQWSSAARTSNRHRRPTS